MQQKNISFDSYAMFHTDTTNIIKSNFPPEIELKALDNSGGCYFINIFTGEIKHS